ncbi:MAG: amidohydrolase family protein, partial [Myxococcota bacterium]
MKMRSLLAAVLVLSLTGCAGMMGLGPSEPAEIVFLGSNILTVDAETQGANAVAIRGDSIVAVGDRRDIEKMIGAGTRVIELGDRALSPGFIDAHGHLGLVMVFLDLLNASSPPVGPMTSVADIVEGLRKRIVDHAIAPGEIVMGYGYDDSLLAEQRHPTRGDLDRASSDHPIALVHVSGHLAAVNSAALEMLGIEAATPDPAGGVIRRWPGTEEPNGVLEETAAVAVLRKMAGGGAAPAEFGASLFRALAYHAEYGITTIQDGASNPQMVAGLRAVAAQRPLPADVAAYLLVNDLDEESALDELGYSPDYQDGVRVAGVKFVLDGSPQGRTAWLTRPYDKGPPGMSSDYRAYPTVDPDHYKRLVARLIAAGIPVLAHANGDAAIDLMIEGIDLAVGEDEIDHRSITIHAQL